MAGTKKATAVAEPFLDIDLDAIATADEPSMTFRLGGQLFRCKDKDDLNWNTIEQWMVARASGDTDKSAASIDDFMSAVLYDDDVDKFLEVKRDPRGPLTVSRQMALVKEVNRIVLGVEAPDPTQQRSTSPDGSQTTGSTSKEKSSEKLGEHSAA